MNSPLPPFPLPHHQPFTILEFVLNSHVYTHIPPPTLHRPSQKFLPQLLSDALLNQSDRDVTHTHTLPGSRLPAGTPLACDITTKVCVCHCTLQRQLSECNLRPSVCVRVWVMVSLSGCLACVCLAGLVKTHFVLTHQATESSSRKTDGLRTDAFPHKPESVGAKYLWLLHTMFRHYEVNETACNSTNPKVRFCMGQSSAVSASGCLSLLSPE